MFLDSVILITSHDLECPRGVILTQSDTITAGSPGESVAASREVSANHKVHYSHMTSWKNGGTLGSRTER